MLVLVMVFLVIPIAEFYVFVGVAHAIGFFDALGVLLLVSIIGVWVVKREGLRVWGRFRRQINAGTVPSREIADGVCILVAGALLIAPGFLSDIVGVLLLLPPTRALIRPILIRRMSGNGRIVRATYSDRIYDTTEHDDPPFGQLGS